MPTFQELFSASNLGVIVPDTSIGFPDEGVDADEWLTHLRTPAVERNLAFFDEKLDYYLTIQLNDTESPHKPSPQLLAFLSHLQISYDATYISSVPLTPNHEYHPSTSKSLTPPVRSVSLLARPNKPRPPPSIFPPATPHPIPSTVESDRRYVRSEGTPLSSGVWGEDASEMFQLLWSDSNNSWVAVYKLAVIVAFVRMNFTDPLLCLTVSTTLREKPAPLTGPRRRLAELIEAAGGIPFDPLTPTTPSKRKEDDTGDDEVLAGLEEVNLLGGLSFAPTFKSEGITMPSTRLGPVARHEAFSLRPITPEIPSPSTLTTTLRTSLPPTLRKSFRKTLRIVSGFRVRMRTVFVPYVLFPVYNVNTREERGSSDPQSGSDSEEGDEWDRERKEAGNDESTVVLCVEVENSGESGMGFTVESVDVYISGEGAKTTLIRWGLEENPAREVFPLLIASMEQYNLLYAVTFLESPEAEELGGSHRVQGDMQRAVTININGRPYCVQDSDASDLLYPTHTFSSRWNCILDFSADINKELVDTPIENPSIEGNKYREALPTPASPFPGTGPSTSRPTTNAQQEESKSASIVSGSKRHTIDAIMPWRVPSLKAPVNYRSSTSMLNPAFQIEKELPQLSPSNFGVGSAGGFTPPSIMLQQSHLRASTTYGSTSTSPPPLAPPFDQDITYSTPPLTPAYPAYSSPLPPTPFSQAPAVSTQSTVGPSVEIRRGSGVRVLGGSGAATTGVDGEGEARADGEPIVVSVGLLPLQKSHRHRGPRRGGEEMIYPNDTFTLDIFVFNQSSWVRRFEVSYPDGRNWGRKLGASAGGKNYIGIMPLENRIRVGPLRPSTCQSVRMDFLALTPGVHPIDTLMLTDIETGYVVNLRSVLDIVVHESPDS